MQRSTCFQQCIKLRMYFGQTRIRLRGGMDIEYNRTFLASEPSISAAPVGLKAPSEEPDWYTMWTPEAKEERRRQISEQPWFGVDEGNNVSTDECGNEGVMQSWLEADARVIDLDTGDKVDLSRLSLSADLQNSTADDGQTSEMSSSASETEYVSENVYQSMRDIASGGEGAAKEAEQREPEEHEAEPTNNIEFLDRDTVIECSPEERRDMVTMLPDMTVQLVDHRAVTKEIKLLTIRNITDLTIAIRDQAIVAPSLPVAIASFLSYLTQAYVKTHDAADKSVGRGIIGELQAACEAMSESMDRLGAATQKQGRWAMREVLRVAEVGLELGCPAGVVQSRIAQRARQIAARRRTSIAEMRLVEEGLKMLVDAEQVDTDA